MDKKRKNNFLEERDKIPYEELLSENYLICDIYFRDGKYYQINGYEINIATDKIFILRKMGKVVEKTIFPISNILAIKEYYLDFQNIKKEEEPIIEEQNEILAEDNKEEHVWLPGKKGRELAKKQFIKAVKAKDRDLIKPDDLKVTEDDLKTEEKKLLVSGQDLLEGKIGNE